MIIDLSSLSSNTQAWARTPSTADVSVTTNGTTQILTGLDAAAYLFGQALGTVRFQDTLDGVQLTDERFEFPAGSGEWVSLSEVADALHYKYGVDPLIEFAPGLGLRGYSVADINGILSRLNQDFAGKFSLPLLSSATVQSETQATFDAERTQRLTEAQTVKSGGFSGLAQSTSSLSTLYGPHDVLSELTAGQYADVQIPLSFRPPAVGATSLSFYNDPDWATGTPISVLLSGVSTVVRVRNLGQGQYSFFQNWQDASSAQETPINPALITGSFVRPTGNSLYGYTRVYTAGSAGSLNGFTGYSLLKNNTATWPTGAKVQVPSNVKDNNGNISLQAGVDYYIRDEGHDGSGNKLWSLYDTQAHALAGGNTGKKVFGNGTGGIENTDLMDPFEANVYHAMENDPHIPDGTKVRITPRNTGDTLSGVVANQDYYVRSLGDGKYNLFTSAAAAMASGNPRPTSGLVAITDRMNAAMTVVMPTAITSADFSNITALLDAIINNPPSYNASAVSTQLDTQSTLALTGATEAELREALTVGGDIYTDRYGAFYINGVPTRATDVAVVSRLLVHDNISAEYQVLMDEYANRNNMIDAARRILAGGADGISASTSAVKQTYGMDDALAELTAGQYTDDFPYWETDLVADTVVFDTNPDWITGTRVRIGLSTGGLQAGVDYFVRNMGDGAFRFFATQAGALAGTSWVDLTAKLSRETNVVAQDAAVQSAAGTSSDLKVEFNPQKIPGNPANYDFLANAYYTDGNLGSSDRKYNYLSFSPIDPGWPEDTTLEFSNSSGGLTSGDDTFVARYDPNGGSNYWAYQLTNNAGGSSGTSDNLLTSKPSGTVMLYDGGSTPGTESITGYNQFDLPGTDFPTETRCRPREDVHVLLKHEHSGETLYKAIVALRPSTDYYLRNHGNGRYSIYDTAVNARNGTETGRLYFQMDDGTYSGTATRSPYITQQTATVNGLGGNLDIFGGHSALKFVGTKDPLWSDGTAVQTRASRGGLSAGVTYYTKKAGDGYEFYTDQDLQNLVPVYGTGSSTLPGDIFRVDYQGLELSSLSSDWNELSASLNTLISNKVRDGDLDQSKLQSLTAQLQNNTEAMTALIKSFADVSSQLAQALR